LLPLPGAVGEGGECLCGVAQVVHWPETVEVLAGEVHPQCLCVPGCKTAATVGVVLMVMGIAGLVISLVLASTAQRTDVVHHSARGDYVEPPRGDDPRV
jgi:hypothetical protein